MDRSSHILDARIRPHRTTDLFQAERKGARERRRGAGGRGKCDSFTGPRQYRSKDINSKRDRLQETTPPSTLVRRTKSITVLLTSYAKKYGRISCSFSALQEQAPRIAAYTLVCIRSIHKTGNLSLGGRVPTTAAAVGKYQQTARTPLEKCTPGSCSLKLGKRIQEAVGGWVGESMAWGEWLIKPFLLRKNATASSFYYKPHAISPNQNVSFPCRTVFRAFQLSLPSPPPPPPHLQFFLKILSLPAVSVSTLSMYTKDMITQSFSSWAVLNTYE